MRSRRQVTTLAYLDQEKEFILLLLLAVGIGVFLGGAQQRNMALFYSLYAFVNHTMPPTGFAQTLIDSLMVYGVQMGAVLLSMQFNKGMYVAKAILVCIGVVYAFTSTAMLMLYGGKGIVVIVLSYTVQMLVLILYIVHMLHSKGTFKIKATPECLLRYIQSGAIVFFLALYNSYIQPFFDRIIVSVLQ